MKPQRIQLSRAKGFRLQARSHALNGLPAVKVDRTTKFGNPFIVGTHGRQIDCVYWYILLLAGYVNLSAGDFDAQAKAAEALKAERDRGYASLRGRNLACWCRIGTPCHADILLAAANAPRGRRRTIDVDTELGHYGYHFEFGKGPVKNDEVAP